MKPPPDPHYRHGFPAEIISHAVWLYHVFNFSLRDVSFCWRREHHVSKDCRSRTLFRMRTIPSRILARLARIQSWSLPSSV